MRILSYWIACLSLTAAAAPADFDAHCDRVTVLSTIDSKNNKIGLVVSSTQFASAPAWQPGSGEVPLSPARAASLARAALPANVISRQPLLNSVSLSSHECNRQAQRWFYVIHFRLAPASPGARTEFHIVGVLLNGTLIHPTPITDGV
jgi:hypothetical protein